MANAGAPGGGVAGASIEPNGGFGAEAGTQALPEGGATTTAGEGGTASGIEPIPSPGCALTNAEVPSIVEFPETTSSADLVVPATYDGVTPFPLLFMLHATNQLGDYVNLIRDSTITTLYVVAAPEAPGDTRLWSFESLPSSVRGLDVLGTMLDGILATVCVDENRLFGVGNGSGGRAMTRWIVDRDKAGRLPRFRALALIGAYDGPDTWQPRPVLFMHPLLSSTSRAAGDADGLKAFETLARANSCGAAMTPASVMGCQSQTTVVEAGCADIGGCAAPLRFCHHDSPNTAGDPWPCFGTAAISQFLEPYRQ